MPENAEFIKEVVQDKFGVPAIIGGLTVKAKESPLQGEIVQAKEWNPSLVRTGVIARKIGNYPLWLKNGVQIRTTLLQVNNFFLNYNCYEMLCLFFS